METATFDRSYTPYILLVELFDVEHYSDLEIWVRGHSRSLKLVPFESLGTVSYSPAIVTLALSLISFATYRPSELLVENREIFISNLYLAPPPPYKMGDRVAKMFDTHTTRVIGLQCG